jgi:GAF domain-containing protein
MNEQAILRGDGDESVATAGDGLPRSLEERFDRVLAVCSRLLLGDAKDEHALQTALTQIASGFDLPHATLFQIESYHTEDNRGKWLACSETDTCLYCQNGHHWDYFCLIDDDLRIQLDRGQSCLVDIQHLSSDIQNDFRQRNVAQLVFIPLTVLGKWWGLLCVETLQTDKQWLPSRQNYFETIGALFSMFHERRHAVEGFHERKELTGALEMAGTVCHKLNQPMQVILGYASMITSGDINEKEQIIEIVQLIEDETRQMGIITKNLMGITKHRGIE